MAATAYILFNAYDVPAGANWNFEWNNLPEGKAYAIDANPFQQGGTLHTLQVEVTRVWRRTRQIQKSGGGVDIRRDILGQIRNVGSYTTSFALILVVFS